MTDPTDVMQVEQSVIYNTIIKCCDTVASTNPVYLVAKFHNFHYGA
jgi:hypothetical protein